VRPPWSADTIKLCCAPPYDRGATVDNISRSKAPYVWPGVLTSRLIGLPHLFSPRDLAIMGLLGWRKKAELGSYKALA
jgi:hypothetical protein